MLTGIGRTTVLVEDQDAALAWYRDVLGFEVLHDQEHGSLRYLHIGVPQQEGVGLWLLPGDASIVGRQTGGEPLLVLYADDLDVVLEQLDRHGVEPWDVRDDGDSRSLHLRDIAGNVLVVAELVV